MYVCVYKISVCVCVCVCILSKCAIFFFNTIFVVHSLSHSHSFMYAVGKLWGWAQKYAVIEGRWLNFYSKPEDVAVCICACIYISVVCFAYMHVWEYLLLTMHMHHLPINNSFTPWNPWSVFKCGLRQHSYSRPLYVLISHAYSFIAHSNRWMWPGARPILWTAQNMGEIFALKLLLPTLGTGTQVP